MEPKSAMSLVAHSTPRSSLPRPAAGLGVKEIVVSASNPLVNHFIADSAVAVRIAALSIRSSRSRASSACDASVDIIGKSYRAGIRIGSGWRSARKLHQKSGRNSMLPRSHKTSRRSTTHLFGFATRRPLVKSRSARSRLVASVELGTFYEYFSNKERTPSSICNQESASGAALFPSPARQRRSRHPRHGGDYSAD